MSSMTAAIYRDGSLVEQLNREGIGRAAGPNEFAWAEITDPTETDLTHLQKRFGLQDLAVEDSMGPGRLPKVDIYDDQIFVVLKLARLEGDKIEYGEIDAFLSRDHIVTMLRGENAEYTQARRKFESSAQLRRGGPDFILHAVMDFVVDSYFPVLQMIEDEVLSMEQQLLDELLEREAITRLFRLRREAIRFQHMVTRMSDVCGKLTNLDLPCVGTEVRPYFRDIHGHLVRFDAMISGLVEVIRAVFEASNLLEQQRQGAITRQLAAWAAILGVPTAIAGIYGMNFPDIPELTLPYGYPIAIAVMLTICVGLFVRFKKLRWL